MASAIGKLVHPGPAAAALVTVHFNPGFADVVIAVTTTIELYLGVILLSRLDPRFSLIAATSLISVFTIYLFYLTTLAQPPSCGCLGLTGLFKNSRNEAVVGLLRNCAILWTLRWSYACAFPSSDSKTILPVCGPSFPSASL
jgi:hypothetical protein